MLLEEYIDAFGGEAGVYEDVGVIIGKKRAVTGAAAA